MALANSTLITVTATYTRLDGRAASGQVFFSSNQVLVNSTSGEIVPPVDFVATLDANGAISIDLPATDDDSYEPQGWTYTVTEDTDGGDRPPFGLSVPADGGAIDLADVAPPGPTESLTADEYTLLSTFTSHRSAWGGDPPAGSADDLIGLDANNVPKAVPSSTYQQRFIENVAAFHGADPSGASNDTQAFADAIATGRTIWVPDGTYNVDANTITPSSGQSILMAPGAVINQRVDETGGPHALVTLTNVDDVDVLGGTLIGRKGTEGAEVTHGVSVAGGSNITLRTHCEKFTRDGAYVSEGTAIPVNVTVKAGMRCTDNGRNGFACVAANGLTVEGGVYDGNDGPTGLDIEPAGTSTVDAVRIGPVLCHSNAGAGLQYFGKSGSEGLAVSGAISRDNTGYGFRVARISHARFGVCDSYRNGDSGWRVDRHVDFPTEHNTFVACGSWSNGGHGFDVPDAEDGDLIGCTAIGNTLDGLLLSTVADWTVTGGEYSGNRNGMNLSDATGATITGASVRGNGDHGIRGRNIVDCGISENTVENNDQNAAGSNGIEITHSTESRDNRVSGNRVRSGGSQDNGIRLSSNSNDNMVTDNDLEGAGTAANISDAGAGNGIRGNKGYVTENEGTATFSGDGSTVTFAVAHGLAKAPAGRAVWAESADAAGNRYVSSVDATNINVTFTAAPASGTSNVVLGFQARV